MGKHEANTPKAIGIKIKAKGLQRLRWYCQLCEKQCRDENGFKCHTASESHLRQMEIFSSKSGFIVSQYSKEFEADFLRILSRQFINSRVSANQVYAEYIKDRDHIHMNATEWSSLTEFVKYLGKSSKCVVEETPKGWYITFINRDPEFVAKKELEDKKEKMDLNEEEKQKLEIDRQIKLLNKQQSNIDQQELKPTELSTLDIEKLSSLELNLKSTIKTTSYDKNIFTSATSTTNNNGITITNPKPYAKKMSAIEEIMFKEKEKERIEKEKLKVNSSNNSNNNNSKKEIPWIIKDIVVKIIDKELAGGKYYKQKGYIISIENEFLAKVKLLESGDVLKIDQTYLETVIPQIGNTVVIVSGNNRGKTATIQSIDFDKFNASLKIKDTSNTTISLPYEDFSKEHI